MVHNNNNNNNNLLAIKRIFRCQSFYVTCVCFFKGLILYNGQKPDGSGDFFSFGLKNGVPEFRYDVGSGTAIIKASEPVTLNEWHTAKLGRMKKHGTMYIDDRGPYQGVSPGSFQGMDLSQLLYIGGVPDFGLVHKDVGFQTGFVGEHDTKTRLRVYGRV